MINKQNGLLTQNRLYTQGHGKPNPRGTRQNKPQFGINRLLNVSEIPSMTDGTLAHLKGGKEKNGRK